MKTFCGAIFDMDGTILDSMDVWGEIDVTFLGKRGIALPEDYRKAIAAMNTEECARYTAARFGLSDTPEELMQEWYDMAYEAYSRRIPLKDGALVYMKHLKEQGVHLAVATSSYPALADAALKRTGVLPLLDTVVTTRDVKRGKGFPDIYIEAAARMGLPPSDCVVFEDIIEGVRAAKEGGFYTVGVLEPKNETPPEEVEAAADRFIRSFRELL